MRRISLLLNDMKSFQNINGNREVIMQATGFSDPFTQKLLTMLTILGLTFVVLFINIM